MPQPLSTADDVVRARISAAIAGITEPLSVTSAPCPATAPQAAATPPRYEPLPALPRYPPMGRRYGSRLERVEAISRFARPRRNWARDFEHDDEPVLSFNSIVDAAAQPPEPEYDPAVIDAQDESDAYQQLTACLRAHRQAAALRELAQLRRVLVLAPADAPGQSWQARLMCPVPPAHAMRAPGAQGQSWPLRTQGTWALTEAERSWQSWRMRQHLRADGVWQLEPSSEGQRAPLWCADDNGVPQSLPAPVGGIPLHLTEPQRLRRLLGAQWTLLVLRAPEPLSSARR